MTFPITPGTTISRSELHRLVGGRLQGRISSSATTSNICLFTTSGTPTSRFDGWSGQHFHFQGEGQGEEDQPLTQGNRALAEHVLSGRTLRLFSSITGPTTRYLGAYRLDPDIPYVRVEVPIDGKPPTYPTRQVLVFRLLPLDQAPTAVPAVEPLTDVSVVRDRDPYACFRPRPTDEPGRKLTAIEKEADRLLVEYRSHLRAQGHDVVSCTITVANTLTVLPVDLIDRTSNELIACSGSVTRHHILKAFGELIDIRRFFTPTPNCTLLVPGPPHAHLTELCTMKGITVAWPVSSTFHRTEPA